MSTAQFVHNTPVPANYLGVAKTADGVPIWKYAMCVRCVTEARMESTPDLCAHTGVKAPQLRTTSRSFDLHRELIARFLVLRWSMCQHSPCAKQQR